MVTQFSKKKKTSRSCWAGAADGAAMEVDGDDLRELEALWREREVAAGAPVATCRLPLLLLHRMLSRKG